jgi:putative sterol carrier protein
LNKAIGGISKVFRKIGSDMVGQYSKDSAELSNITKDLKNERDALEANAATDSVDKVKARKEQITKLEIQQSKLQISTADTTATAIGGIVLGATAGLTAALAEGTNIWTGLVLGTLDAMSAMMPMLTAMILGKEFVEKGVLGFVTAAVMTGALRALVAVARAAVSDNGFYDGGYTGDGNDKTVKGVVHEKEYVVSKAAVKGEVTAFDKLHKLLKGGESMTSILSVYENSKNLSNSFVTSAGAIVNNSQSTWSAANNSQSTWSAANNYQNTVAVPRTASDNSAAVINELRTQTAVLQYELAEIRNSTDMIPTTFKGATNVNMNAKISLDKGVLMKEIEYNNRRKGLQ